MTADGTTMAEGSGPCPGPPERTRADAWSLLAGIQFLQHIWDMTSIETRATVRITIYNRNTRIIRRINDLLTFTTIFCNSTLDRDWDILKQITDIVKTQRLINVTWHPMKDFLDTQTTIDIRNLPHWKQRLLDTKQIATTAIDELPPQLPHSPFLPASRCMLHHTSSTVHGKYNNAYREAATLPAIFSYLQKKHAWTETTKTTVQWSWFKNAIRRPRESSKVNLTKLIYNQLATQARKSITGGSQWVESLCPHCPDTPATFQHLLRCKDPLASTFRENLKTTINSICHRRRAPTIIRQTLQTWISSWLQCATLDRTNLDPRLQPLFDAQSEIGWDLMVRGFYAKEWTLLSQVTNHTGRNHTTTTSCSRN